MERQNRYSGLTAIERLDIAGLRSQFDAAAQARSRSAMIRLVVEVELADASWFVDAVIANPRRYGY